MLPPSNVLPTNERNRFPPPRSIEFNVRVNVKVRVEVSVMVKVNVRIVDIAPPALNLFNALSRFGWLSCPDKQITSQSRVQIWTATFTVQVRHTPNPNPNHNYEYTYRFVL